MEIACPRGSGLSLDENDYHLLGRAKSLIVGSGYNFLKCIFKTVIHLLMISIAYEYCA